MRSNFLLAALMRRQLHAVIAVRSAGNLRLFIDEDSPFAHFHQNSVLQTQARCLTAKK